MNIKAKLTSISMLVLLLSGCDRHNSSSISTSQAEANQALLSSPTGASGFTEPGRKETCEQTFLHALAEAAKHPKDSTDSFKSALAQSKECSKLKGEPVKPSAP